jgi:hypothetical protein
LFVMGGRSTENEATTLQDLLVPVLRVTRLVADGHRKVAVTKFRILAQLAHKRVAYNSNKIIIENKQHNPRKHKKTP